VILLSFLSFSHLTGKVLHLLLLGGLRRESFKTPLLLSYLNLFNKDI